jgi:branched-chain amino acid transport system permease protein
MEIVILQAVVVGVLMGGVYGLFSVGLSLILGVAGIMHFVHGDFLMIAMYLTLGFSLLTGLDPYITTVFVLPSTCLLAFLTYQYAPAVKRIIALSGMKQMLFMLGFSYFLQNLVLVFVGSDHLTVKTVASKLDVTAGDIFISATRFIAGVASVLLTLGLMFLLNKTDLGRSIRAVTQDRDAAAMMGINVNRAYMLAWVIGLGMLGVAGPMLASIFSFYPLIGNYWLMIGFMCVVMGGLGNIMGALISGFIMGIAFELGNAFLPGSTGPVLPFMLFVIVLLFKPEGLFGEAFRGVR